MGNITLFSQIIKKIETFSFQENRQKKKNHKKRPAGPILKKNSIIDDPGNQRIQEKTASDYIFLKVEVSTSSKVLLKKLPMWRPYQGLMWRFIWLQNLTKPNSFADKSEKPWRTLPSDQFMRGIDPLSSPCHNWISIQECGVKYRQSIHCCGDNYKDPFFRFYEVAG